MLHQRQRQGNQDQGPKRQVRVHPIDCLSHAKIGVIIQPVWQLMMQKGIPNFINPTDIKEGVSFLEEAILLLNLALIKQAKK